MYVSFGTRLRMFAQDEKRRHFSLIFAETLG